ncbi:unnamed protein product [Nippostrongylus brasiliensis]|uniref:DUF2958 domain-containing protein n=1 Tax=Nippostrongylus brasiliensis TaxID=27835 RepID=A0A0N4XH92_NIPBR|nr:unnamed protein product [Nippostrongylus brasiliensis]
MQSTWRLPSPSSGCGFRELRVTMDGVPRHDELRQPFTLFVPLQTMDAGMKLFRRPYRPDLRVEISDDDLVEGMIFD